MTYQTVNNVKLLVSIVYAVKAVVDMLKDFFVAPIKSDFNSMFESPAERTLPLIRKYWTITVDWFSVQVAKFTSLPYMVQSSIRLIAELVLIGTLLLLGLGQYIIYLEVCMLLVTAYFAIIGVHGWLANR